MPSCDEAWWLPYMGRMARSLHEDKIAFNVIGWVPIHRPCEFVWWGPQTPEREARQPANGPVYIGKR